MHAEKTNRVLLARHLEKDHKKKPEVAERNAEDRYGHLKMTKEDVFLNKRTKIKQKNGCYSSVHHIKFGIVSISVTIFLHKKHNFQKITFNVAVKR